MSLVQDTLSKEKTVVVDSSKHITLDLEGKTLTTSSSDYVITNYGDLEIIDSSDDKTGKITSTTNHTIYNGSEPESENTNEEGDADPNKIIQVPLNNIEKYNEDDEWVFEYRDGKLKNNNNTQNLSANTTAKGYIELDLTGNTGKYTLDIDTKISTYSSYGYGYVSISNNPDNSDNVSSAYYGNLISVYGDKTQKGTIDIVGGQKYYLNFQYRKSRTSNYRDDEFTINSITLTKKQEGTLTLTEGNIEISKVGNSNKYYSAIENAGILNMNGGKVTSGKEYTVGISTLNGGTSNITKGDIKLTESRSYGIREYEKGSLTKVTGGNIRGYYGVSTRECLANVIITGGTFDENCYYPIYGDSSDALITIKGITLNKTKSGYCVYSSASSIIIDNCEMSNSSDVCIYKSGNYGTVKISNSKMQGARAIYSSGSAKLIMEKCNINTNGYAISSYNTFNAEITETPITVTGNDRIIYSQGTTNLTITNSPLSNVESKNKYNGIELRGNTNLYLNGTTSVKSAGAPIYCDTNSVINVNIESGEIESTGSYAIAMNSATGNINIGTKDRQVNTDSPVIKSPVSNWTILCNRMHLNFYDGKLIGGEDKVVGVSVDKLEDGYELVKRTYEEEDGTENDREVLILGEPENLVEVIKNGQVTGTKYATLQEAVMQCGTEGNDEPVTIKLLENVNQTKQVKITKNQNIKLDLNGHKLYAMTDDTIYNEGTLEVVDNNENSDYEYNLIGSTGATIIHNAQTSTEDGETEGTVTKGNLKIGKGVKISYTASGINNSYKQAIKNDGNLNMNEAEITVTGSYAYAVHNTDILAVSGGKIDTKGQYSYGIYSNSTETAKIENVQITCSGERENAIYNDNTGLIEIKEKTIITASGNNSNGVYNNKTGTITIQKGTTITTEGSYGAGVYNSSSGKIVINGGDITASRYAAVYNYDGTIDINDGNIKSTDNGQNAVYSQRGTMNIKAGTITSTSEAVYMYNNGAAGTTNIMGGTITSTNSSAVVNNISGGYRGKMTITGGTIISEKAYGVYNRVGTLTIGEKIPEEKLKEETPSETVPSITGATYGVYNEATFNFYDGAITGATNQSIKGNIMEREAGYQVVITDNGDGTETSTLQKVAIAEIKEEDVEESKKEFTSVKEIQQELEGLDSEKNYILKVRTDFSVDVTENITIPENRNITLDINGHTITSANEVTIINNGNLTIKDSENDSTGSITNGLGGSRDSAKQVINNKATLNMESGKIVKSGDYGYGVHNFSNATINMTGGTITTSGNTGYGIYNEGELNINEGEIVTNGSSAYGIYNLAEINLLGGKITTNGSSSHGVYNESTQESQIEGAEIIVNKGSAYALYNYEGAKLYIKDGTTMTSVSANSIYNGNSAEITISGGRIESNSDRAVENYKGTVNITGGTLISNKECIYSNGGTSNITGGLITSNNSYGIYNVSGTVTLGKKISDITGIESQEKPNVEEPAIKGATYGVCNEATFNFYDGKIIGASGQSINQNITDKETKYQIEKTLDAEGKLETATLQELDILEVDGTRYKTIVDAQTAIDSLGNAEEKTINVLNDFYICLSEKITIPENKNIKLNLNGHTIEASDMLAIENEGNLKITDETPDKLGKILGVAQTIIDNKNVLEINGGTYNQINYSANYTKTINNTGKLTWRNGTLSANRGYNYAVYNSEEGTIDWLDGELNISLSRNYQYGIYQAGTGTINWKAGSMHIVSSSYYTSQYGIYIKGTGDLNIETIDFKDTGVGYSNYGNKYASYQYFLYSDNTTETKNKVTVNDFKRTAPKSSGDVSGICGKNLELLINGGDFKNFHRMFLEGIDISLSNSTIDIKGGTFEETVECGEESSLTIDDGSISKVTNSNGTVIINKGDIGYLYNNYGNTTMNGGRIHRENGNAVEINYASSSFTLLGGTVQSTGGYGVYINGGTFIMGDIEDEVSTSIPAVTGSTNGVYKNSGTFNFYDGIITGNTKAIYGNVDNMPDGYKVVYDDGEITAILGQISEKESVVSINNIYFDDIETAMKYANKNNEATIIVHRDLDIQKQLTIEEQANITINLNAHSITGNLKEALIKNNGQLTIIDEVQKDDEEDNGDEPDEPMESIIENTLGYAIVNENILTLGKKDNQVNPKTPHIKGTPDAIQNNGTLNWYDGKINDHTTETEQDNVVEIYSLARKIASNVVNIIQDIDNSVQTFVQEPKIRLDSELPIWTNEDVNATIYTTGRVMLDIVNIAENVELRSIEVKKVWEMPDDEADNYRATIQLMKIVDGKKVEAKDKQGNKYIVKIVGNNTQTIENIPVYQGSNKIEYALEEIKVERKSDDSEDEWEDVPLEQFNVTYKNNE